MDWEAILKPLIEAVLVIVIPAIGTIIGKLLVLASNNIKNATVRGLAIQAVLWAEDKFGADTASGAAKLNSAIALLVAKTGMSQAQAEIAIRAAYQNIFAELPKATLPSGS
jgi:hypothetical protein